MQFKTFTHPYNADESVINSWLGEHPDIEIIKMNTACTLVENGQKVIVTT